MVLQDKTLRPGEVILPSGPRPNVQCQKVVYANRHENFHIAIQNQYSIVHCVFGRWRCSIFSDVLYMEVYTLYWKLLIDNVFQAATDAISSSSSRAGTGTGSQDSLARLLQSAGESSRTNSSTTGSGSTADLGKYNSFQAVFLSHVVSRHHAVY